MTWKKGESGNKNGRPKAGHTLTDALAELVDRKQLAAKLWALADAGDTNALKYIYDRIEGRPGERITFAGDAENPLHVHHSPREP